MQGAEAKHLRGVSLPNGAAVDRGTDPPLGIGAFESIARRHRQQATDRIIRQLKQQPVEVGAGQVGAGGVVNQDPITVGSALGVQQQ
ncbi:hypothetical protein D3C78_1111620 [compost metagenome]